MPVIYAHVLKNSLRTRSPDFRIVITRISDNLDQSQSVRQRNGYFEALVMRGQYRVTVAVGTESATQTTASLKAGTFQQMQTYRFV